MTGPSGSSAAVPKASLASGRAGTPNNMTERRPFWTSGARWGMSLLRPRRCWFGRDGMKVSSSGLSEMKRG